jgi:DNA repair exonuclease SbcCD ATPase subunit
MSTKTVDDRYLHSQIEDLLTALSELQRNHSVLSNQLQQEREEREEDRNAILPLLKKLKENSQDTEVKPTRIPVAGKGSQDINGENCTLDGLADEQSAETSQQQQSTDEEHAIITLSELAERVEERFQKQDRKRRSSIVQTKVQLREELTHAKDQLASAMSQTQDFDRRIHDLKQEVAATKEQLRESHAHVRTLHQEKHRLEKLVQGMRSRTASTNGDVSSREHDSEPSVKGSAGGLREFKLGRSKSTPSQAGGLGKRLSSLPTPSGHESTISVSSLASVAKAEEIAPPLNENEALLIELAQSKTAEAVAKQEAEEAKQKLEAFRKAYGMTMNEASTAAHPASNAAMTAIGVLGRLTGQGATTTPLVETNSTKTSNSTSSGPTTSAGGFWAWRR